jgi:hypothetical protein
MMGMHRQQAGLSFAGLLAAGRGEDAAIFAREVMERAPADDDERARKVAASNGALRVALVDRALEIGQGVRENAAMLRAMLDEAAKEGADVAKARAALDETLQKPAQPAPKAAPAKE